MVAGAMTGRCGSGPRPQRDGGRRSDRGARGAGHGGAWRPSRRWLVGAMTVRSASGRTPSNPIEGKGGAAAHGGWAIVVGVTELTSMRWGVGEWRFDWILDQGRWDPIEAEGAAASRGVAKKSLACLRPSARWVGSGRGRVDTVLDEGWRPD